MRRFTHIAPLVMAGLFTIGLMTACSSYRANSSDLEAEQPSLEQQASTALNRLVAEDPTMQKFIDEAYGYAVIPEVTKGAAGIGAAHGEGVVYENGDIIGYTTMTQGTLGAQLGGQVYSQVIFFEDKHTFDHFKQGNVELSARASAVAASAGAGADADYEEGVAIFTMSRTGLMFEAAIGGQKFSYSPKADL